MNTRNTGYKVRRAFRGQVLWLVSYTDKPLSFQWSTCVEKGKEPLTFESSAGALQAADKAAREYGAECAVVDPAGNLLQPAAARTFASKAEERRALSARDMGAQHFGALSDFLPPEFLPADDEGEPL